MSCPYVCWGGTGWGRHSHPCFAQPYFYHGLPGDIHDK